MDIERGFSKHIMRIVIISFILFIFFSALYIYISFNTKINVVSIYLNSATTEPSFEVRNSVLTTLLSLKSLFIFQLLFFLISIVSLCLVLWYGLQLYYIQKRNALIDPLTKLYNRRAVFFELKRELNKTGRYGHPTSVAMVDMDFFKKYNDSCGHIAGDKLLKRFAGIIKECVREYDFFGRYGGEEFIILFPETGTTDAEKICERLREKTANTKFFGQEKMPFKKITISVGIAGVVGKRKISKDTIIQHADKALYMAKESGRNKVVVSQAKI